MTAQIHELDDVEKYIYPECHFQNDCGHCDGCSFAQDIENGLYPEWLSEKKEEEKETTNGGEK